MILDLRSICRQTAFIVLLGLLLPSCVEKTTTVSGARVVDRGAYVRLDRSIVGVGERVVVTLYPSSISSNSSTSIRAADVVFFLSGGTSNGTFGTLVENDDGSVSADFIATQAGTETYIKASVRGKTVESFTNPSVRVTPGDYSTTFSQVDISTAAPAAGSNVTITVSAKSSDGSNMSSGGLLVSCSGTTGTEVRSASAMSDLGTGIYTGTIQARKASSSTIVKCRINGTELGDTASFTAIAGTATQLAYVNGNAQSTTIGTALVNPFEVQVSDDYGNPVNNAQVNWSIVSGSGTLGAANSTTNALGRATMTYTPGNIAGSHTVLATLAGLSTAAYAFNATASAAAAAGLFLISGNSQQSPIGSAFSSPLTVEVRDAFNNVVSGATITWAQTAGTGTSTLSATTTTSSTDGRTSITVTPVTTPGTHTITATLEGVASTQVFNLVSTIGPPASLTRDESTNNRSGRAGDILTGLKVTVKDSNGSPIVGTGLIWTVQSGGGEVQNVQGATDAQGQATADFKLGLNQGVQVVRVSSAVNSLYTDFSATATVGDPHEFIIDGGDNQTGVIGESVAEFKVLVRDDRDVPLSGKIVRWNITAGQGNLSSLVSTTGSTGLARTVLTLREDYVGDIDVTATLDGTVLPSVVFDVTAGYNSQAQAYFTKLKTKNAGVDPLSEIEKRKVNAFVQGLKNLELLDDLREMWFMRGSQNLEHGTYVYGFSNVADATFQSYGVGDDKWDPSVEKLGVMFHGDQNADKYLSTSAGTKKTNYTERSIIVSFRRNAPALNGDSYVQTSNASFTGGSENSGGGFIISDEIGWGKDNEDYGRVDQPGVQSSQQQVITTTFKSGVLASYLNGRNKITGNASTDKITDNYSISFGRNKQEGVSKAGLDGRMSFAADFTKALTDTEVLDIFELYRTTVGLGLGL